MFPIGANAHERKWLVQTIKMFENSAMEKCLRTPMNTGEQPIPLVYTERVSGSSPLPPTSLFKDLQMIGVGDRAPISLVSSEHLAEGFLRTQGTAVRLQLLG